MVITECSSIVLTVKPNGGAQDFVDTREWIPKKGVDITGHKHLPFLGYSILFLRNRTPLVNVSSIVLLENRLAVLAMAHTPQVSIVIIFSTEQLQILHFGTWKM
jgi:hypothetical protein